MGLLRLLIGTLAKQQDLALVALLMAIVFMMILPLPTQVMDVLIAGNITIAITILLVIITIQSPVEFSTFPSVILVSTLFRLSISISTTRLILLQGDAGKIVDTFGAVVIGGNLVVGLVVFLIITVVQFLVITNGADRVAEVSARFTLDGMPGKQMSIDADVRAGNIDQAVAKKRRSAIEQESQLFGAMDGAMKFVKGDAVAGLVITSINLVGGILIGIMQRGLPFGEAVQLYSVLTIGDGLISQVPALLISISSGAMVTRVKTDSNKNLGGDIMSQMFTNSKVLKIASVVLLGFGFIPGFPTIVFAIISGIFFMSARSFDKAEKKRKLEEISTGSWSDYLKSQLEQAAEFVKSTGGLPSINIFLPHEIMKYNCKEFCKKFNDLQDEIYRDTSVVLGYWKVSISKDLDPTAFSINLHGTLIRRGHFLADYVYVALSPEELALFDITPEYQEGDGGWISEEDAETLKSSEVVVHDAFDRLFMEIRDVVFEHLASFITVQDVSQAFLTVEKTKPILIEELKNTSSVIKVADVLKRLVEEDVLIRNMPRIFEAIMEWSPKETNPILLVEYVRLAIANDIIQKYAQNNLVNVILVAPSIERALREGLRSTPTGSFLVLPPDTANMIIDQVRRFIHQPFRNREDPVLVTQMDIRRHLRNLLSQRGIISHLVAKPEMTPLA
jgi:type III secretion protein V